ncbi:uncharacterized protein LOC113561714 isoform X1 [Ooceraea biroi]|uniref:uncharacterized protein LOC113561714 isoform X1 n=1 Tax=Ooceraea biroi TaxID=2015173 RepID=UPI000F095663|nr:uncharacterized protein LOC113561714 isoform X1 [Ooceraea biroi]
MDYAMVIRVKKPSFYTRKCFEARKIVELSDPKAVNHVEDERLFLKLLGDTKLFLSLVPCPSLCRSTRNRRSGTSRRPSCCWRNGTGRETSGIAVSSCSFRGADKL